ncbi:MAG TPA: tRNA (adenosine(37)-N6)-dimethylallyltransferase MiaA [Flavisolibacter sp.]|nr:tRNA (adenosine(37)-N6)-dimethylallyltransferase MiaA [Flavisolibacter sp.]
MAEKRTVVIIAGPTAVGKTSVAIQIAQQLNTEIISADSRQCFRELKIGVARPSEEELHTVKHHFIASHSIHEKITAATFESYALQKTEALLQQYGTVVMVGGTGLYIKAFTEGVDEFPEVPEHIHNETIVAYQENGLEWLQAEVQRLDPLYYAAGEVLNPQRLMRAFEVFKATGQSILRFRKGEKKERPFNIVKIGLALPREELHRNINARTGQMMENGLLEEARSLIPYQHLNALQTVGYRECFAQFKGEMTTAQTVEDIRKHTRQYAKRQMTWFRKDPAFQWTLPDAGSVMKVLVSR